MKTQLHYKQCPDCLSENMDGDLLLFNPANTTTLHLDGPSSIVWKLCTGEHSVLDIIEGLQEAFPEQSEQIEGDVISVLKELIKKQVIDAVDAPLNVAMNATAMNSHSVSAHGV